MLKSAQLVLIVKRKKYPNDETYRQICLLKCLGKLYEKLINKRLGTKTADYINESAYKKKKYCVLTTLEVKNSFNTVSWQVIVTALTDKNISQNILRVTKSYLSLNWLSQDGVCCIRG